MDSGRDYVTERNELIPAAVRYANRWAGLRCGRGEKAIWAAKWNNAFHVKMKRLAQKAGISR